MRNIIDSINSLSKSFDTIHEEDDDIEEYDEETLVEEAESHQLKEEVLKKVLAKRILIIVQVVIIYQRLDNLCNEIKGSSSEIQLVMIRYVQLF